MSKTLLALCVAALAFSTSAAMAQKKQLVIVVKGLDNPFFEAIHQGCEKWNKENAASPYHCFYTGPASTSDGTEICGPPDPTAQVRFALSTSIAPWLPFTESTAAFVAVSGGVQATCRVVGNSRGGANVQCCGMHIGSVK